MPHEVLARILSLAWRDGAGADVSASEALFRVGSLCRALRAAAGATGAAAALTPVWSRAIIALVDPAAALATAGVAAEEGEGFFNACYQRHAAALGGWYALAHALANRNCVACGEVTRWLAWRDAEAAPPVAVGADEVGGGGVRGTGLCRCCATCALPQAEGALPADAEADAEADAGADAASEDEEDVVDDALVHRCAVINAHFFAAEPTLILDAADWAQPGMKLMMCVMDAHDGDTIGLRGEFTSDELGFLCGTSVRLLGMPPAVPWRWVHFDDGRREHGALTQQLRGFEQAAAAALGGFPGATIHVKDNCLEVYEPIWIENVFITSGTRGLGAQAVNEDDGGPAFAALTTFMSTSSARFPSALPSCVLLRCWITAYKGTGIVLCERSAAALLRCVITNSRFRVVHANDGATLRMRGCHVLSGLMGDLVRVPTNATAAAVQAVNAANVFCGMVDADEARTVGLDAAAAREQPFCPSFDLARVRLLT
jgi:hypothetical protein